MFYALVKGASDDEVEQATQGKSKRGPTVPAKARLRIRYRDSEGSVSEREIHAFGYVDSSPGYIEARCLKAKGNRSFRTDRIVEAIDLETGEIIKRIPTFIRSKYVD